MKQSQQGMRMTHFKHVPTFVRRFGNGSGRPFAGRAAVPRFGGKQALTKSFDKHCFTFFPRIRSHVLSFN